LAYGKVLGVKIPDEMSATDLENPQVLNSINQQKMMSMRASGGGGQAKEKGQGKAEKNPKELTEIKIRSKVVNDALDKIDQLIQKKGTYEAFGSHNKEIDQLINSIAVNYNKIIDPTSVVREGEAAQVAESLGLGGNFRMLTSDKTARDQLKSFKEFVNNQTKTSIQNYMGLADNTNLTSNEKELLDYVKENPDDGNAKRVYDKMIASKGLK
jgi:uncharacterized protein (DUF4415 family)